MIEKQHPTFMKKYLSSYSKLAFFMIVSIGFGLLIANISFPENTRAASLIITGIIFSPILYFIEYNKFKINCPECNNKTELLAPEKENDFYFAICSSCKISWNLGIQKKDEMPSK